MTTPLAFFIFQKHTIFIPLKYVYGECFALIEKQEQLSPLHCLRNNVCPVNAGCMDTLAKRVNYLFTTVAPDTKLMVAYFKYRDKPDSIRAGIFNRDMTEPAVMTLNRSAFRKFQRDSLSYTWIPTNDYLLMRPSTNLIPVESLLVKANG